MRRYALIVLVATLVLPTISNAESSMYDRVCPRVVSRFQNDAKMWDRVNERIQQRFGFTCSSASLTKSSSSSSSHQESSASVSSSSSSASTCKGPEGYCELLQKAAANLDLWTKQREKLTEKMKVMSNNTQSGCMSTLASIDADWVSQYNNYLEVRKSLTFWNLDTVSNPMRQTEGRMFEINKRIDAAPTFCY